MEGAYVSWLTRDLSRADVDMAGVAELRGLERSISMDDSWRRWESLHVWRFVGVLRRAMHSKREVDGTDWSGAGVHGWGRST